MSEMWHHSTPYDSHQNIPPHTISAVVITGISFSTDTIVPEEYYHIHCFNPVNFYPLIGYNRIINRNMSVPQ